MFQLDLLEVLPQMLFSITRRENVFFLDKNNSTTVINTNEIAKHNVKFSEVVSCASTNDIFCYQILWNLGETIEVKNDKKFLHVCLRLLQKFHYPSNLLNHYGKEAEVQN